MEALLRRLDAIVRSHDSSTSDRDQYIIEELYAALETGTLPWHELSPDFKDIRELPARDMGIDSASEECAVQTKWRPASQSVGAREIAMFLGSAKLGPKPWSRAIVATQDGVRLPRWRANEYERINIDDTIRAKWREHAREYVESPESAPREVIIEEVELRDYQREAIDLIYARMCAFFRAPDEAQDDCDESFDESTSCDISQDSQELEQELEQAIVRICLPCGSGKSLIIAQVIRRAIEGELSALLCVPSRSLLAQFDELFSKLGIAHGLRGTGYNDTEEQKVTICVYDSICTLERDYAMILVDEAHHLEVPALSAGAEDSSKLARDIRALMIAEIPDDESVDEAQDCDDAEEYDCADDGAGTSASARASTCASTREQVRAMLCLFSATLDESDYEVSVESLIERNLLSDFDVIVPVFDNTPSADDLARYVAHNRSELRAILVYSNRLENARAICDAFNARGITCGYFDGSTSLSERGQLMRAFEDGRIDALSTVDTISEGQNLPRANCCIFAEPRRSRVAIVQCIGRILRKHSEKIMSHIIVPYAKDGDDEVEVARIIGAIDCTMMRKCAARRSSRISIVRGTYKDSSSDTDIDADIDERKLLYENIYDRIGTLIRGRDSFDIKLEILRRFVAQFNRLPKHREIYEGFGIGHWASTQRKSYHAKRLQETRIIALQSVQGWSWSNRESIFVRNVQLLKQFVTEHGRMIKKREIYRGIGLGVWMQNIRKMKFQNLLSDDQIAQLNDILYWTWRRRLIIPFETSFSAMQDFIQKFNRLPLRSESHNNIQIGSWLHVQRASRQLGQLTSDRIAKLESLHPCIWSKTPVFEINCTILSQFIRDYTRLPRANEVYNDVQIGRWLTKVRDAKRKGQLTVEQIRKLESFDSYIWCPQDRIFMDKFALLCEFIQIYNRLPMGHDIYKGMDIGQWVSENRHEHKQGKLSEMRIAQFNTLTGWWWSKASRA